MGLIKHTTLKTKKRAKQTSVKGIGTSKFPHGTVVWNWLVVGSKPVLVKARVIGHERAAFGRKRPLLRVVGKRNAVFVQDSTKLFRSEAAALRKPIRVKA